MPKQPQKLEISRQPEEIGQDLPAFLLRILPIWGQPSWLEGKMWRTVEQNQPVTVACRDALTNEILSLDWKVVAKDADQTSEFKEEIAYYTQLFLDGYDTMDQTGFIEWMLKDMLTLPFGAGAETGREGDKPDGKVLWIHPIDGATLYPTLDINWPVGQRVYGWGNEPVYFPKHGITRMYLSPRTEIQREGWGMGAPEKIYLALELLSRGDRYYANLLLDTPTAGILDLGDMEQETARSWLKSWQSLMTGIDAFKIPVLYEHTTKANFIPFGKPPTDIMFDQITQKYAALVCAGYGLNLADIGLSLTGGGSGNTLAGTIRSEKQSKRGGKSIVKRKVKSMYDRMLPPYLEFKFIDYDDELNVSVGRARLTSAQAFGIAQDKGQITPDEGRQQMIADGLFTINMADNIKGGDKPRPLQATIPGGDSPIRDNVGHTPVPPSQGGKGEIQPQVATKSRAEGEIYNALKDGFDNLIRDASDVRCRRLIRVAAKAVEGEVGTAINELYYSEVKKDWKLVEGWNDWYDQVLFDAIDKSEVPEVVLSDVDRVNEVMQKALDADPWWRTMSKDNQIKLFTALIESYTHSMSETAHQMANFLYEVGEYPHPWPDSTAFDLTDEKVRKYLDSVATAIIQRTNDGSGYFLRRIVLSKVRRALSIRSIADGLHNGTITLEHLFDDRMWMSSVVSAIQTALIQTMEVRSQEIPANEDLTTNRMARVEMYSRAGLKLKAWRTLGPNPCTQYCIPNEKLGYVPLSHVYQASFPEGVLQPQAHNHCACELVFSREEIVNLAKSGKFKIWSGGENSNLAHTRVTL